MSSSPRTRGSVDEAPRTTWTAVPATTTAASAAGAGTAPTPRPRAAPYLRPGPTDKNTAAAPTSRSAHGRVTASVTARKRGLSPSDPATATGRTATTAAAA